MDAVFVMAMLLKNANSSRPPWGHQSLASNIKICTHLRCHSSRAWQLTAKVTRSTGFDFYCSYKGNAQNRRLFCVIKMFFSHWKLCLVSVVSILKGVDEKNYWFLFSNRARSGNELIKSAVAPMRSRWLMQAVQARKWSAHRFFRCIASTNHCNFVVLFLFLLSSISPNSWQPLVIF